MSKINTHRGYAKKSIVVFAAIGGSLAFLTMTPMPAMASANAPLPEKVRISPTWRKGQTILSRQSVSMTMSSIPGLSGDSTFFKPWTMTRQSIDRMVVREASIEGGTTIGRTMLWSSLSGTSPVTAAPIEFDSSNAGEARTLDPMTALTRLMLQEEITTTRHPDGSVQVTGTERLREKLKRELGDLPGFERAEPMLVQAIEKTSSSGPDGWDMLGAWPDREVALGESWTGTFEYGANGVTTKIETNCTLKSFEVFKGRLVARIESSSKTNSRSIDVKKSESGTSASTPPTDITSKMNITGTTLYDMKRGLVVWQSMTMSTEPERRKPADDSKPTGAEGMSVKILSEVLLDEGGETVGAAAP